jgi:hypothetical protein
MLPISIARHRCTNALKPNSVSHMFSRVVAEHQRGGAEFFFFLFFFRVFSFGYQMDYCELKCVFFFFILKSDLAELYGLAGVVPIFEISLFVFLPWIPNGLLCALLYFFYC